MSKTFGVFTSLVLFFVSHILLFYNEVALKRRFFTFLLVVLLGNAPAIKRGLNICFPIVRGYNLTQKSFHSKVTFLPVFHLENSLLFFRNRNFIRQYGGIENICKKLQESPSQQVGPCETFSSVALSETEAL